MSGIAQHSAPTVDLEVAMTHEHINEVTVQGRLSGVAEDVDLPSGDVLTRWRLVVERTTDGVDTLDCITLRAPVARSAHRWQLGDVVRVEGALRRRFWRSATGLASRTEIDVARARRVASAA